MVLAHQLELKYLLGRLMLTFFLSSPEKVRFLNDSALCQLLAAACLACCCLACDQANRSFRAECKTHSNNH